MANDIVTVGTKVDGKWTGTLFQFSPTTYRFEQVRNDIPPHKFEDDIHMVQLGLFVRAGALEGYDGGFYLTKMALDMLKEHGVKVDEDFYEDVEPCPLS
jgi:hypothetical protein